MNVLVCIKRIPATGATLTLTENQQEIETRNLGFTIGPHEECAVEAAVILLEEHGGESTVLTLGEMAATEQLRDALALREAYRGRIIALLIVSNIFLLFYIFFTKLKVDQKLCGEF